MEYPLFTMPHTYVIQTYLSSWAMWGCQLQTGSGLLGSWRCRSLRTQSWEMCAEHLMGSWHDWVTKGDLVNIAQALHPNKPERHHKDVTSVAASVHSFDNKDDLPVITYKQPGVAHFDPILREGVEAATAPKSFSTIVDGAQCQAAQSQGNSQMSVVWIDSMHGTHSDSANSDRFLMDTTNEICLR